MNISIIPNLSVVIIASTNLNLLLILSLLKLVLNFSDMIVLDGNNKLIPISNLGWDENYKSYVSITNEYMNNIYWFRLLQGMNEIKVIGDCILKIECEYPRKAGCL